MAATTGPAGERRTPLSRERVLRAAVDLADGHGLEALTMRKLGQELGVEAMSLYKHVAQQGRGPRRHRRSRARRDRAYRPTATDWRTAMRRRALSARAAFWPATPGRPALISRGRHRPGDAAQPGRGDRQPARRRASRSRWPRTRCRCWTATSTASPCRRRTCRSTTPEELAELTGDHPAAVPPRRLPAPRRDGRRAHPAARLRLRRRVRVRPRPDPRRPRPHADLRRERRCGIN